ncbi:MAG TPA: carboxypeptidase regulatory-like domain-containing protein [Longimicrobium sp.]|nr:carboxypeptidase regulatory-like domain-containing protein [Longimicrobium sp.]
MASDQPIPGGDDPVGPGGPPPTYSGVEISQITPVGAALTSGVTATLTGRGFQPGAAVWFGNTASPGVTWRSENEVGAVIPDSAQEGTVSVTLVNPDDSTSTLPGGFTYVATAPGENAEVLGVFPTGVIEDTQTDVTLRGRHLLDAYANGLLALRGPTRATVTILGMASTTDAATGLESLTFTLRVTASPALQPLERMAIQVLASRRPGATGDGVVESSRRIFTVLPKSIPVPLAFTPTLQPDGTTLVVVAGRNLAGSTLALGEGTTLHMQRSDDSTLAGLVSVTGSAPTQQLSVKSPAGAEVARYTVSVQESAAASSSTSGGGVAAAQATTSPAMQLELAPVPNQQVVAPTESDSAVFDLSGTGTASSLFFDWFAFEIVLVDVDIIVPLLSEVRLIPFFDGGGGDLGTEVLAKVGSLVRVRGAGLLVALRVDLIVRIRVVLIIAYRWEIWDFGVFNEFDDLFPWAIGSVTVSVRVEISIRLSIAALLALVEPGNRLRVLASFNLTVGIDFTISTDGSSLDFGHGFTWRPRLRGIGPLPDTLLPCNGIFQLASDQGATAFADAQGTQAFYFARAPGECCLPWSFDLDLVRFDPGGGSETVQQGFQTEFCLTAAPTAAFVDNIVITSENPSPEGFPPTLVLELQDIALVKALGTPKDAAGNILGPPQDVRDLGWVPEFYLESATDTVLEPGSLEDGTAWAVLEGDNVIRVRLHPADGPAGAQYGFWPGAVAGFDIVRALAAGEVPRLLGLGTLPVSVAAAIVLTPVLAYRTDPNDPATLTLAPTVAIPAGGSQNESVWQLERVEPFEAERRYWAALRIDASPPTRQRSLTVKVASAQLELRAANGTSQVGQAPLAIPRASFQGDRGVARTPDRFFTGTLHETGRQVTVTIAANTAVGKLIDLGLEVRPNLKEDTSVSPIRLVPPGQKVGGRHVLLDVTLQRTSGARVQLPTTPLRLAVVNDETFEEYLRTFADVQALMAGADAQLRDFAPTFLGRLPAASGASMDTTLNDEGVRLWTRAWQVVQAQPASPDDRPLYWARLQAIAALRAHVRRKGLGGIDDLVLKFEQRSRGLDAGGRIDVSTLPAGSRKVIVTGFDPFQLPGQPDQSNPSGLAALAINGKPFGTGTSQVYVRTAVFPVRYRDFDAGRVETAVRDALGSIVMLMTLSDNVTHWYDVERWAARHRLENATDNENLVAQQLPAGAEWVETTLPLTVVTTAETIPGPNGPTPFVIDQSYMRVGVGGNRSVNRNAINAATPPAQLVGATPGVFRPEPVHTLKLSNNTTATDTSGYTVVSDVPSGTSDEGSGGSYLSNEIFYRTAVLRNSVRSSLKSGHVHIAPTGTAPRTKGPALVSGVSTIIERFVATGLLTRASIGGNTTLPATEVGRVSSTSLNLTNTANAPIQATVEVTAPFSAVPTSVSLSPGTPFPVEVDFSPPSGGTFTRTLTLRETGSGEVLATTTLTGQGVPVFTIGGVVTENGAPRGGVTVTLAGTKTGQVGTGSDGRYLFTQLPQGGSYTVTPSLAHYTFTPPSATLNALAANQTANFAATVIRRAINGRVKTASGTGIQGATLTLSGTVAGTATSDATGAYQFTGLPEGGNYTVAASRVNYTFSPSSQAFNNLSGDMAFDFPGSLSSYTLSGHLTLGGAALAGATVTLSGSSSGTATTDANGAYSFTVLGDGSYTVTPSKVNHRFTPPSASFSNVSGNLTADFTAELVVVARTNVASLYRGGAATASSEISPNRAAYTAVNNDRRGLHQSTDSYYGGGWHDATADAFPDWLEVAFNGVKTISEVDVYTVQDNQWSPVDPTESLTFSSYGIQDFDVEYWTGSAWQLVPGGQIVNNNRVWRQIVFAPLTTSKIRVVVKRALNGYSRIAEVEAWDGVRVNVALESNGAVATGSSTYGAGFEARAAINGDRRAVHWGSDSATGSGWHDATPDGYPDVLEVAFVAAATISEVDVFSIQDNYASPAEPTEAMTFTQYGVQDFEVQYWTGSAWVRIPGALVTGNDRVWRKVTFPPLTTTKIRLVVTRALASHTRIAEIEAW